MNDHTTIEAALRAAEADAERYLTEGQQLQRQLAGRQAEYRLHVGRKFKAHEYAAWRSALIQRSNATRAKYLDAKARVKELRRQAFDLRCAALRSAATPQYQPTPHDIVLLEVAAGALRDAKPGTAAALVSLAGRLRGAPPDAAAAPSDIAVYVPSLQATRPRV